VTLLTTEIHRHDRLDAVIVFAADRRITRGSVRDSEQPKIFSIPRLHAGIGYFGLAEVPSGTGSEPMALWLQRFVAESTANTLGDLAHDFAGGLNAVIPARWRQSVASGFHLCGFTAAARPEFWYVRNCDDTAAQNPTGTYAAREDFQGRDASRLAPEEGMIYRNGDIRPHVLAWEKIDQAFGSLLAAPDFNLPRAPIEYTRWVEFKMDLIAQFYERFCRVSIIGRPVDAFFITW
jgi:hypothetical protein